MNRRKKAEKYIEWSCPYCGHAARAPKTARVHLTCPNCGKERYTSGIEVENEKATKFLKELKERRKREIEADKENE